MRQRCQLVVCKSQRRVVRFEYKRGFGKGGCVCPAIKTKCSYRYLDRSELPGMKGKLLEYNIKGNGHYEPAEHFFQIVTGDFFGDPGAY